ncbi:MAG: prealbumin-like fold domain-containing protein [Acutalibacteraceae bacterium]
MLHKKGVINITKTGEIFSSVEENKGVYTPKYSISNLKGTIFEIYAAEDITTLDGTVRYEQGTLVDTITTDDDGVAKSKELYLGKYTFIERLHQTDMFIMPPSMMLNSPMQDRMFPLPQPTFRCITIDKRFRFHLKRLWQMIRHSVSAITVKLLL